MTESALLSQQSVQNPDDQNLQGKQPILFSMQFIDWCECETQQCVT